MREGTTAEKKIQGRKRHLLVDTQGLLNSVKVLAADIADREGGKELLLPLVGKLPRLQLIWADSGYTGEPFKQWVKEHLGVRRRVRESSLDRHARRLGTGRSSDRLGQDHAQRFSCLAQEMDH
jgi:transposase